MNSTRLNKYLATHGYASRRAADELIKQGRVKVNGRPAHLGDRVSSTDRVEVDLPEQELTYLAYHKPRGVTTEAIKAPNDSFPLGRLDKDSEGLLLFTNDGRLTDRLLNPKAKHDKEYLVTVDKKVAGLDLKRLSEGVRIEHYQTKPAQATRVNDDTFRLILTEGKKHQIRRMAAALGYQVERLKRVRILNITLHGTETRPGTFRALTDRELDELLRTLKLNRSRSAASPSPESPANPAR